MSDQEPGFDLCKLREKFRNERRNGDVHKAYSVIQYIIGCPEATLRDFFAAGECSIRLNRFSDAVKHLSIVITICENSGDAYFLDQSYFWRAYSLIKLGKYEQAKSDLDLIRLIDSPFYVYSVDPEKSVSKYFVTDLLDAMRAER